MDFACRTHGLRTWDLGRRTGAQRIPNLPSKKLHTDVTSSVIHALCRNGAFLEQKE